MHPTETNAVTPKTTDVEFAAAARSQLATLSGEIAERNTTIQTNDAYVYGDYLSRSLKVPVGHDFTPVNWLRRTCEIHRTQTMGDGFTVSSSYHGVDSNVEDPNEAQQLELQNEKMKSAAEDRNKLFQAILRDNDGLALFANIAENGSAIGTSVVKAWYDEDKGKYCLDMVEAVENFYAAWSSNSFREADFYAYVWQVSKQRAIRDYDAPENVVTSPLGSPLNAISGTGGIVSNNMSTQPMVTIMEVTGKVQGWKSDGKGNLSKCKPGDETKANVFIVGNEIQQVIDNPKYMPNYYIFPNKKVRRRAWGQPDISSSAISINQTYIETLSDWRTVQNKVNFPKFKAFGFGLGTQMPKPKSRTVEIIGLGEGQDIQPIQNPNSQVGSEIDFIRAMDELKQAYVRETGISRQLFDIPDSAVSNSNQAALTAMKSISDQVEARRMLWSPIIQQIFYDALECLALWDDNIASLLDDQGDWYIRTEWPPAMRKDDPTYMTLKLNRLVSGTMSVQSFLESLGENAKEEIDRIADEMKNPTTAAIHGKLLAVLAESLIMGPPSSAPPKVAINLRGDLTPEQETNLSVEHGFGEGPIFGPTSGPQGELGIRATDNAVNDVGGPNPRVSGQGYSAGSPIISGDTTPNTGGNPQMMTPPGNNQPGQQPSSQPGSGQPTPNSPEGNLAQQQQRQGRK